MEEGKGRRFRSKAERRRIVEETLVSGASVSRIARAHGVNANQVFHWRKLYRTGQLDLEAAAAGFLPVRIESADLEAAPNVPRPAKAGGMIDVDLGHARVRIEGTVDPGCVRAALEALRR